MGRPGGGILALRGHASIQGSTDIPTLFNLLPGYLPMPHAHQHDNLDDYTAEAAGTGGFWGNQRSYMVSLLKAWWGDAAQPENDFCFDYLPRIDGDHSSYRTISEMIAGKVPGYFLVGENPAVGHPNARMNRLGLANLEWLVVRDLQEIESASFWYDAPEIETGELVTEQIATEVFLMPAASHVEKEGTFTQTQRMLQWRDKAVEPPGDARSDLWFYYHLGPDPAGAAEGLRPTRGTGRCWTSPGTTRRTARRPTRTPRRCCARSTAWARTARRCRATCR